MTPHFSRNATCFVLCILAAPVAAQDTGGGEASLETGASYSSLRGPLAFVGLNAEDLMGSGTDVSLGYQAGESGEALTATIRKNFDLGDTAFGFNTRLHASLDGSVSDWDIQDYASEHYQVSLAASAETMNGLQYSARVFWQSDSIDELSDTISPLVTALDASNVIGLGATLGYSTMTGRGPMATGFDVGSALTIATSAGDREWAAAEVNAQYNTRLPGDFVLSMKGEVGQIRSLDDDDVHIVDRAFIGNPAPRGFAYAGIGPRDTFGTDIDTALGGNSYLTSSVEVRMATPHPDVVVGAFADAGALWDLDQTEGGASGVIDDSYSLRTAIGVSVYWDTPIGLLQLNLAKPIDQQETDLIEQVSLNLNFNF